MPTTAATAAPTTTTEVASTTTEPPTTTGPATTEPATTEPETTEPETTEPETTEPETTEPAPTPSASVEPGGLSLPAATAAFGSLVVGNQAVSVTIWHDHLPVLAMASGVGAGGQPVTSDTPMVLASVSKLITAKTIARLATGGAIDVDGPVPWDLMGIAHDPAWDDVTVRELLQHSAGMPKARSSWLNDPGSCAIPLTAAVARPPIMSRGTWLYSNGNYCALGLLIEAVTGVDQATAARVFVFDPIEVEGPHLSTDGLSPIDGPYAKGIGRLERLGGAGTWLASSDDVAGMLDSITTDDLRTMTYPGIMIDQYGWGHTGTVDGAKACAWVMNSGRTIVVGIVAGNRPSTGGEVCDALVPALATDLGIWADEPRRLPV